MTTQCVVAMGLVMAVGIATGVRAAPSATTERAARDAVALFVYPNIQPGGKWTAEDLAPFRPFRAPRDDAKRWLLPMPERQLRETLEPVLEASRPGYPAYVGAAYILAYRGIDVSANARRISSGNSTFWPVLLTGRLVPLTPPALGADRAYLRCKLAPDTIIYAIPDRLATVYTGYRDPTTIRVLINNPTDGCYGEYRSEVVSRLLLRYRLSVLRAAAVDRQAAERVQWAVNSEHASQNEAALRKALNGVIRSGGNREADLARKILRKLDE